MRPDAAIPFVRKDDQQQAAAIEEHLIQWSGGAGWLMFASVRAFPRLHGEDPEYGVFVGVVAHLSDREAGDVVATFLNDRYPDLQVTVQARRGSVR